MRKRRERKTSQEFPYLLKRIFLGCERKEEGGRVERVCEVGITLTYIYWFLILVPFGESGGVRKEK